MKLTGKGLENHIETLLLALLEEGPSYGYEMVQALNAKAPGIFKTGEGTVYPVLHRLEERGQLVAEWRIAEDTGRKRKYYRLSPKGKRELSAQRQGWAALQAVMEACLGPNQPNPQPSGGSPG